MQEADQTSQIPEAEGTAQIPEADAKTLTERQALERVHAIWEEKNGLSSREDWMKKIMDTVTAAHGELDR